MVGFPIYPLQKPRLQIPKPMGKPPTKGYLIVPSTASNSGAGDSDANCFSTSRIVDARRVPNAAIPQMPRKPNEDKTILRLSWP